MAKGNPKDGTASNTNGLRVKPKERLRRYDAVELIGCGGMVAKPKTKKAATKPLEIDENAWPKFEALLERAAKMGHKPHKSNRKQKAKK